MVAGVLLAAGAGRRMGGRGKLLLPVGGVPLVRRAAGALAEAGLSPLVVVVAAGDEAVGEALSGLPVLLVENPRAGEGMGTSLAAGVRSLPPEARAVVVGLGDMPRVRAETVRRLEGALRAGGRGIAVPTWDGRRGHPVAFDLERYRAELCGLGGDEGARGLLAAHAADVLEVAAGDPGVLADVDTPAEYRAARAREGEGC